MNLQTLLGQYLESPHLKPLVERLAVAGTQQIFLKNLHGSASEFVAATLFNHEKLSGYNHVFVLNDGEEAAYFHNTLTSLTSALNLFYFPSSFKTKKNFRLLNASHVMLRTEALTRFSSPTGNRTGALITYPEALFEKVVLPKTLSGNIIHIKTNDTLNLDSLMELFVDYGFVRTDFVYEPGQFALRGGILDIYSFGNDKPYRVELFGNEVDSIRLFDPESQLSERKLLQVSIIPNVETQFEQEDKVSLLDFLPENTIYWIRDWDVISEQITKQYRDMEDFQQKMADGTIEEIQDDPDDTKILKDIKPEDFQNAEDLRLQLQQKSLIEFGYQSHFTEQVLTFQTREQPAFNRNFNLLIQDLKTFEQKKYAIYLFSEQSRQLERLNSIFTDLETEIKFTPISSSIHEGFIDDDLKMVCYTDHQIFQRYHKYHIKQAFNKNKALTLKTLRDLQPGDYVTHIDHGVGRYSGLQKLEVAGSIQEAVRIIYKDNDILYVNINSLHKISKYTGKEGTQPKANKLGSDSWNKLKEKTKTKVKEIAFDLIKLYAQRKAQSGFAFSPDNYMQTELEASFIYEDTPDQSKATADVKKDMENAAPMDRLICGDVGFGKTEIAVRAAFKAVVDGKQAAILVPTTILAFQHYKTFSERLADFPVTVDYINRFKSAKEKKETLTKLAEGKIDIIVGTHALLGKSVKFRDLGLMVIDEEQKFGVGHKEKLKTLRTNVDSLTLTATPIPRTLQFSMMGARDLSIINTAPPNRQPIQTEVVTFNQDFIREAIYFEIERGGQVFFIFNRIQGVKEMSTLIQTLCPDLSVSYAHGQMDGKELEAKIMDFVERKYDVLVCTNIVESGVDIPNVNTIIVNNAHHFGLSDLHQLRGRVGRSNKKAFCYLIAPPLSTLPADSRKRLQTLEQYSDLGSGFQIAMRDLDIRGAGNLLGGEQSGFMAEIGFEMYQKVLQEAIRELKRTDFKELFKEEISQQDDYVSDCTVDTDQEILIPDAYVESITERLALYTRLNNCTDEQELITFYQELIDRFGPVPRQVDDLFAVIRSRKMAISLGFEKMTLKDKILRCYFINKNDSPYFDSELFKNILNYLQTGTNKARLKQAGTNFLLINNTVESVSEMQAFLQKMWDAVKPG
ncbi:transcription-repair coupling factor [Arachidicoccus terrestris]|uniref:transcription-repair coupling factor n=1 Tax=Arachidicoccus terrestris TaxID=2875539 RepID=UPI001CC6A4E1|nr:transcription-repair coupling factor [Arachidicoccus terrestris]UAY53937.1 transcription-repair coupling factor [Arachidicoccus terrestris]